MPGHMGSYINLVSPQLPDFNEDAKLIVPWFLQKKPMEIKNGEKKKFYVKIMSIAV